MIELRQFRQFIAVAEELSFRRAAERLHMAQPPLTMAIRKMEEELGVVLLERGNRVTKVTEAGEVFLREARRAVAQAERAVRMTKRAGEGFLGSLRVSFVASVANGLLPRVLLAFRSRFPNVELELQEGTTSEQLTALELDRVDVGFIVLPIRKTDGLMVTPLLLDQLLAAVPAKHPLARSRSLKLSQLAEEPWVLFPEAQGPGLYGRILKACSLAGFSPRVAQEARQMETIVGLVAGGLGVSVVPRSIASKRQQGVAFRELQGHASRIAYELALAYRPTSPLAESFVAVAREAVS